MHDSLLLAASLLAIALAPASPQQSIARSAPADAPVLDLLVLELPDGAPERFQFTLPLEGRREQLILHRHSLRSDDAMLLVPGPDGRLVEIPWPEVRSYRGELLDRPELTVTATLTDAGLRAQIHGDGEVVASLRPAPGARARHELLAGPLPGGETIFDCGMIETFDSSAPAPPKVDTDLLPVGPCQQLAQIAFDADHDFYVNRGGTVQASVDRIEEIMNAVDFFYARDVKITHVITAIVVRTSPFYFPTSGGDLLDTFVNEWNTNMGHIEFDLAHLMTGKPGSLIEYGGLAYVGTVCTSLCYAWSMDSDGIVGHEVGHNWGAGHCHDTEPCNNMCGACMYIAPVTKDIIIAFRDTRTCLDPAPAPITPLPPYGHPESFVLTTNELAQLGSLSLDVLANDHDGNCQPIRIAGFDPVTPMGATLSVSPGTGAAGKAELVWTPPGVVLGTDSFDYVIGDGTTQQGLGTATVKVKTSGPAGRWALDDGDGDTAVDSSANARHGTLHGGATWTTGFHGGALHLDGVDDHVEIPPLNLHSDTVTITAWLKSLGTQQANAGIVYCYGGSTTAGLRFRQGGELGYRWSNDSATFNFSSGLFPPAQQWVFTALVVEPDRATLYLHDGTTMQSAVNVLDHEVEEFDGPLMLGLNAAPGSYNAFVELDEVRVHDRALDTGELLDLVERGGQAQAPLPPDGGCYVPGASLLRWESGFLADSHDVYLGADFVTVQNADNASPEFRGNQSGVTFDPGALTPGVRYYWRVDEVVGAVTLQGEVWQFVAAEYYHWRLDETSGSTAHEEQAALDGYYVDQPVLGLPGAAATSGTSVGFDGLDDAVLVPTPLGLDTDRLTITTWLWKDGPQNVYSGLVFSRDGGTVAGLTFGRFDHLGYAWNDVVETWVFDSELFVPDQTWVFAALVVQPERATLYLGNGGVLEKAVNELPHGVEEFDGALYFALNPDAIERRFQGRLDDVRVYAGALGDSQIEEIYGSY